MPVPRSPASRFSSFIASVIASECKPSIGILAKLIGRPTSRRCTAVGFNSDTGPRCVPLVHQGSVILFGAAGDAYAV